METVLLFVLEILACFGGVVAFEKLWKKSGVVSWVSLIIILANIQIYKYVDIPFGTTSVGSVAFASIFLGVDIINEKYGEQDAKDIIKILFGVSVASFVIGNLTLAYPGVEGDTVGQCVDTVLNYTPLASIASTGCMLLASYFDVKIFNAIKRAFPNQLWLRNNVSTMITNISENVLFFAIAVLPYAGFEVYITVVLVKSCLEFICALFDTPFLYLSKWLG